MKNQWQGVLGGLVLLLFPFLSMGGPSCRTPFVAHEAQANFDTLLLPQKVLLYKNNRFVVEKNQAVGIKDGKIAFVGKHHSHLTAKKTYHLRHHLLSPGLVNAHTHIPMSLFKGLVDDKPLQVWLDDYILPLEKKMVDAEFIRAGTRLAALELIKGGITTFADMYFYNGVMAQVLDQAGLRGIIGIGVPGLEEDAKDWKNKFLKLREQYADHTKISFGLAPHAPYSVSPEELKKMAQFSNKEAVPVLIHVAEGAHEMQFVRRNYEGKTPIKHLHDLGLTGPLSLFVHAIHAGKKDREILAKTQTSVAYNPESNMKISAGIAPVEQFLAKGISVGIGTDGSGSNNNLNLFEEMGSGVRLQALTNQNLTAMDVFKMATITGAKALGLSDQIGTIEEGKWADLIAIDTERPEFYPPYNMISHIVYSANGSEVDFVMVGGDVLMEKGQVKTLDKREVLKESAEMGQKIEVFVQNFKNSKKK